MEPQTDYSHRRQLIIWWSVGGLALLAILALLFWAGYRSGETSPPAVSLEPTGESTPSPVATSSPVVVEDDPEPDPEPENQPPASSQTAPPTSEPIPGEDPPSDDEPDQTLLQSPGDDLVSVLPDDWDDLSPTEKISLNPFDCDLTREEINFEDGRCRRRSTLSSKSKPWNPVALNLVSTTEVEDRALKLACYNQDLSYLLNTPSQPARPGVVGFANEALAGSSDNLVSRAPVGVNSNSDSNDGFDHCILRVALEMTIDGFYFPNGCRTWRPGFVKLVGTGDGQTKTYNSLSTPGPGVVCTKVVVPIAKGQQIEQIFLFRIPGSDSDFEVAQIKFDLLEPKLTFSGDFGFKSETKLPTDKLPPPF